MKEVLLILIFILIAIVVIAIVTVGLIRNNKVYRFRNKILKDFVFKNEHDWQRKVNIYKKVSYEEMAFDLFRPLTLETYWSKKDIEILTNNELGVQASDTTGAQ
jgi:hypothetical protein